MILFSVSQDLCCQDFSTLCCQATHLFPWCLLFCFNSFSPITKALCGIKWDKVQSKWREKPLSFLAQFPNPNRSLSFCAILFFSTFHRFNFKVEFECQFRAQNINLWLCLSGPWILRPKTPSVTWQVPMVAPKLLTQKRWRKSSRPARNSVTAGNTSHRPGRTSIR